MQKRNAEVHLDPCEYAANSWTEQIKSIDMSVLKLRQLLPGEGEIPVWFFEASTYGD